MLDRVPAHVPAERVRQFDVYRVAAGACDMIESAALLAETSPSLIYTPLNGGHWIVAGYEDAARCARDTATFSSFPFTIPTYPGEQRLIPLLYDPPLHTSYRTIFSKIFTPKMAMELKGHIRKSAARIISEIPSTSCDFVQSFSELLPVSVFLELMGLPLEQLPTYRDIVKTLLGSADLTLRTKAQDWIVTELSAAVAIKEEDPREDLISAFIRSEVDGRPVTSEEVLNMCMMIFTAGLDTVTVSLSYGMRYLAEDQNMQQHVRTHPQLIPELVEEFLRRFSPAQPGRTVVKDTKIDGVRLKRGDRVFLMLAAANLDSSIFALPRDIQLSRPKTAHLAFNVGPHRCVGMHLARVELQIAYEEWLAHIPSFRIDPAIRQEANGGHVFSIGNVPLRWDEQKSN